MAGWYDLSKSGDGQFHFVLKSGMGETLLTSERYKTKSAAENGIASVQTNSLLEARYDRKTAINGKSFFNLKAANHQVVGTSPMFATEALRDAGITRVKTEASSAVIKGSS